MENIVAEKGIDIAGNCPQQIVVDPGMLYQYEISQVADMPSNVVVTYATLEFKSVNTDPPVDGSAGIRIGENGLELLGVRNDVWGWNPVAMRTFDFSLDHTYSFKIQLDYNVKRVVYFALHEDAWHELGMFGIRNDALPPIECNCYGGLSVGGLSCERVANVEYYWTDPSVVRAENCSNAVAMALAADGFSPVVQLSFQSMSEYCEFKNFCVNVLGLTDPFDFSKKNLKQIAALLYATDIIAIDGCGQVEIDIVEFHVEKDSVMLGFMIRGASGTGGGRENYELLSRYLNLLSGVDLRSLTKSKLFSIENVDVTQNGIFVVLKTSVEIISHGAFYRVGINL